MIEIQQQIEKLLELKLQSADEFDIVNRLVQHSNEASISVLIIRLIWIIKDIKLNEPDIVNKITKIHAERAYKNWK